MSVLVWEYGCEICGRDDVEVHYSTSLKKFVCKKCAVSAQIPKGYKLYP